MSDNESISTIEGFETVAKSKSSRGERKARKMLIQNNQKCIDNVSRVVFRQNDGTLYVIDNPEVYKHGKADTFLVFGKVVVADTNLSQIQAARAAMEINSTIASHTKKESLVSSQDDDDDDDGGVEIDESCLNALDIELVMSQANVSRQKAVVALLKNDNDLVNAIMDLTQ